MAINRVEIKDFLVFKGEFSADFCPGVNVIIGGNATGKTTLMRILYWYAKNGKELPNWIDYQNGSGSMPDYIGIEHYFGGRSQSKEFSALRSIPKVTGDIKNAVFIPEKDILEHAKGLLTFIEQKQTGFGKIYKDVLLNAQDIPTQEQSATQQKVGEIIADTISGTVHWDKGDGSFYTLKPDGNRIPFANEASGYKKLGFLGLVVTSGQLEKGSILLWDEPENSMNPELISALVDILLELQRGGVQIFIATHSEILARNFAAIRRNNSEVMFYSLYKDGDQVKVEINDRFDLLERNKLTAARADVYHKELDRGLSDA